jgi:hypothetical protein
MHEVQALRFHSKTYYDSMEDEMMAVTKRKWQGGAKFITVLSRDIGFETVFFFFSFLFLTIWLCK